MDYRAKLHGERRLPARGVQSRQGPSVADSLPLDEGSISLEVQSPRDTRYRRRWVQICNVWRKHARYFRHASTAILVQTREVYVQNHGRRWCPFLLDTKVLGSLRQRTRDATFSFEELTRFLRKVLRKLGFTLGQTSWIRRRTCDLLVD